MHLIMHPKPKFRATENVSDLPFCQEGRGEETVETGL